jgi:hypothetical protein
VKVLKGSEYTRRDKFLAEAFNANPSQSDRRLDDLHRAMKELGIAYERRSDLKKRWKSFKGRSGMALERAISFANNRVERFAVAALEEGTVEQALEAALRTDPNARPLSLWRQMPLRLRRGMSYKEDFVPLLEDAREWLEAESFER